MVTVNFHWCHLIRIRVDHLAKQQHQRSCYRASGGNSSPILPSAWMPNENTWEWKTLCNTPSTTLEPCPRHPSKHYKNQGLANRAHVMFVCFAGELTRSPSPTIRTNGVTSSSSNEALGHEWARRSAAQELLLSRTCHSFNSTDVT